MFRVFDVWERSERNSHTAVTPFQTLMIQSIHTGDDLLMSTAGPWFILFVHSFSPYISNVHVVICVKDAFCPQVILKLTQLNCADLL